VKDTLNRYIVVPIQVAYVKYARSLDGFLQG
jgi:hypothetical protein